MKRARKSDARAPATRPPLRNSFTKMTDESAKPRRYPRKQLQEGIVLAWQGSGARHVDRAKTLGMGGLYIETPEPPAAGTHIQVLIDTKEGEVRARAVVRISEPGRGMGVEFVGMDQTARGHLHGLIQRLLA